MTASLPEINRVGVVGVGKIGSGVAEACARAELDVVVAGPCAASAAAGQARLARSLTRALRAGKLSIRAHDAALARVHYTTDMDALAGSDLVVEAVEDDEDRTTSAIAALDHVLARRAAILATTSSSMSVARAATATSRPERVIGMRAVDPVSRLVELIPSMFTATETTGRVEAFLTDTLRRDVLRCADHTGFVVTSLLVPYLLSAIRMLESGKASAAEIDRSMVLGCAHPLGPLALADRLGLDTVRDLAEALHTEHAEPQYVPPELLVRMVDDGLLGRKSGRGFHVYAA